MHRLEMENGVFTTDPNIILQEQWKFYSNLYAANPEVCFTLQNSTAMQVTEEDRDSLEQEITMDEISKVVATLKKDKSQGCDSLTAEFYQELWTYIGPIYYGALKQGIHTKCLHLSAQRGIISLIPKKDKFPFQIRNWRPLTMLTMDYKILATVLASRLKAILP